MEGLLCETIEGRRAVSFRYGKDGGSRLCHPHILYEGSTGKLLVDCYQVGGYSSSGSVPGWKPFELRLVSSLELRGETFDPAPGYNPANRSRYVRIVCAV